jgi:hypothetical protein
VALIQLNPTPSLLVNIPPIRIALIIKCLGKTYGLTNRRAPHLAKIGANKAAISNNDKNFTTLQRPLKAMFLRP